MNNKFAEQLNILEEIMMLGREECDECDEYNGVTRRGIFFRLCDPKFVEYYADEMSPAAFYDTSRDPNNGGIVNIPGGNPYKMKGYIAIEKIPPETLQKLLDNDKKEVDEAIRLLREMC